VEAESAELVVVGPGGARISSVALAERVTVGRLPELNDVALQPDPELFVSRTAHCVLENVGGIWEVVDGGSVNGTFLRRRDELERVDGRAVLRDGDVVCVLASVGADGSRRYFELAFRQGSHDNATRAAPLSAVAPGAPPACLAYDAQSARLVLQQASVRHEIRLRPQGHRLVRHMAERNAAAGGTPVLCSHDELMRAVWREEPMHTRLELARLVWELRRELRRFGAEELVESERGRGYRLTTCADR
jgi:FHA domain/Transcriptional regulatory protein, C terminal